MSKYTWIVTKDEVEGDTSDSIGKIGPPGASTRHRFDRVISGGEQFRLVDDNDVVKFSGFILGKYQGAEPLAEYGWKFGCVAIEYRQNGRWTRFAEVDGYAGDTGIGHFSMNA